MTITHILFGLNGILVDGARILPCYTWRLGIIMAERCGGQPAAWADAHRQILADWDSYYADLDLSGDDGLTHLWEGLLRTTRALFRLTATPEPDQTALTALAQELPYLALRGCDACYPEVRLAASRLAASGLTLGIASPMISAQARGLLEGGGLLPYFTGPILAPDVTGHFPTDAEFYRSVPFAPAEGLVVAHDSADLAGARAAGMGTVRLLRGDGAPSAPDTLSGDLTTLFDWLRTRDERN